MSKKFQISFDELEVFAIDTGYVARCLSGWSFSIHDRLQPGCRDLHHDSNWSMLPPHATKFVLLTSFFEVISEVTEHSSAACSSDQRTTSRQCKTISFDSTAIQTPPAYFLPSCLRGPCGHNLKM